MKRLKSKDSGKWDILIKGGRRRQRENTVKLLKKKTRSDEILIFTKTLRAKKRRKVQEVQNERISERNKYYGESKKKKET